MRKRLRLAGVRPCDDEERAIAMRTGRSLRFIQGSLVTPGHHRAYARQVFRQRNCRELRTWRRPSLGSCSRSARYDAPSSIPIARAHRTSSPAVSIRAGHRDGLLDRNRIDIPVSKHDHATEPSLGTDSRGMSAETRREEPVASRWYASAL